MTSWTSNEILNNPSKYQFLCCLFIIYTISFMISNFLKVRSILSWCLYTWPKQIFSKTVMTILYPIQYEHNKYLVKPKLCTSCPSFIQGSWMLDLISMWAGKIFEALTIYIKKIFSSIIVSTCAISETPRCVYDGESK